MIADNDCFGLGSDENILISAKINVLACEGMWNDAMLLVEEYSTSINDNFSVYERCMESMVRLLAEEVTA